MSAPLLGLRATRSSTLRRTDRVLERVLPPLRAGTSACTGTDFAFGPGNPLKAGFISEPCYNLVYLELAACRLTALPADLARLAPNLRNLNLNYNFLEDVRPLAGLTRMRRLTLVGSRVAAAKALVRVLRGMLDVEMLDFRYAAPARFFSCFASSSSSAASRACGSRAEPPGLLSCADLC